MVATVYVVLHDSYTLVPSVLVATIEDRMMHTIGIGIDTLFSLPFFNIHTSYLFLDISIMELFFLKYFF
jgi:hypothetical protein